MVQIIIGEICLRILYSTVKEELQPSIMPVTVIFSLKAASPIYSTQNFYHSKLHCSPLLHICPPSASKFAIWNGVNHQQRYTFYMLYGYVLPCLRKTLGITNVQTMASVKLEWRIEMKIVKPQLKFTDVFVNGMEFI